VMILVVFFVSLALAGFEVHNISISESYPLNQILVGDLNITVEDFDATTLIESNRNHQATFFDLLDRGLYTCYPSDCSSDFKVIGSNSTYTVPLSGARTFGVYLNGTGIKDINIDFDIDSTFSASGSIPLQIRFFENPENHWSWKDFTPLSEAQLRDADYGLYRSQYATTAKIGTTWTFCQQLYLYETDLVWLGADLITGSNTGYVEMMIFDPATGNSINSEGSLYYNPNSPYGGISFESSEPLSTGYYDFCLRSYNGTSDEYLIYQDRSNNSQTGFNFNSVPGADDFYELYSNASSAVKEVSYSIFIMEALYASSDKLEENANLSGHLAAANSYVSQKYLRDCSQGCYLPFVVYGIPQNFTLKNLNLDYSTTKGPADTTGAKFYELEEIPATVDFSGVLDLGVLKFPMNRSGIFKLFLDDELLGSWDIRITDAPIINGIYPTTVPAAMKAYLHVDIDYNVTDADLVFDWDFGDGTTAVTYEPKVAHKYANVSEYLVKVSVRDGNLTNQYQTTIYTANPKEYVQLIHQQMSISLNESKADIRTFPEWQKKAIEKALNIVASEDELQRIKNRMDRIVDDAEYLEIATQINAMDLPRKVFVSESYTYNTPTVEDFSISDFAAWNGETLPSDRTSEEHLDAVARWMDVNAEFSVNVRKLSLIRTSGVIEDIMMIYFISFKNKFGGDGYLVLEAPIDTLTFNNIDEYPKDHEQITILPTDSQSSRNIEFFVLGGTEIEFFATSEIKYLVFEAEINPNCNFNLICESANEDYKTCRSDCKPLGLMIFYIILAAVVMLVIYTLIQIWYDNHYEGTLFKDKNRVYNLVMYVTSAQNKGMSREEIKKSLREKGWTSERIEYIVRKANGERVGLYEIIPISKFMASSRKKTVERNPQMGVLIPSPSGPPVSRVGPVPERRPAGALPPGSKPGMPGRSLGGYGSRPHPPVGPARGVPPRSGPGATPSRQQSEGNINKGNSQSSNEAK